MSKSQRGLENPAQPINEGGMSEFQGWAENDRPTQRRSTQRGRAVNQLCVHLFRDVYACKTFPGDPLEGCKLHTGEEAHQEETKNIESLV